MPINIHVVGDERWVLAKQMGSYLRELEKASKLRKIDRSARQQLMVYEAIIRARLKGLPELEAPEPGE